MLKELITPARSLPVVKKFIGDQDSLGTALKNSIWDESDLPDVAMVGIADDRLSSANSYHASPDAIREKLYRLTGFSAPFRLVDLGNVKTGAEVSDTFAAVRVVAEELSARGIPLLILGGNQSYTVPLLDGMGKKEAVLTVVDDRLDNLSLDDSPADDLFLHNLSTETIVNAMGVQSFFVAPDSRETFAAEFKGSLLTLGQLRNGLEEMEPFLRESDLVSFDYGSLKLCEAPGQTRISPNGLTGEEACQLAWYSGISTNPGWFAFFGYTPDRDPEGIGAMMAAQICWYFLNGRSRRIDDIPQDEAIDFLHYIVPIEGIPEPVTFLKHPVSKRWWIEVPSPDCEFFPHRIPCSKRDYRLACKNEIPDRWWTSFNRSY